MTTRRLPTPPPLWVACWLLVSWLVVCRVAGVAAAPAGHVDQAFWFFLVWLAEAVWQGLEAVGHITLAIVAYSVQTLWAFARRVFNAALDLGKLTAVGFKDAWGFVHKLYDDILKPAWLKMWALVDRVRGALDRVLTPVLKFLAKVRTELLALYTKWIRPVLDTIDTVRKVLRVLETLHVPFAQKLDQQLARFEGLIDKAFAKVLGEINKVMNFVNRIATADGLFQRLALIRSIQRDIVFVDRVWHNLRANPFTDDELAAIGDKNTPPTLDDVTAAFKASLVSETVGLSTDETARRDDFVRLLQAS